MEFRNIHNVMVIGGGIMGWQITLLLAQHRYHVLLTDIDQSILDQAKQTIEENLARRVQKGKLITEKKDEILQRITYTTEWESEAANQDLVIEAVTEKLNVKQAIFAKLAQLVQPGTICATNSSTMGITKIVEGLPAEFTDYTCNLHFFNPVFKMLLIELYCFNQTNGLTMLLKRMFRSMRYEVIVMKKLIAGFIVNRILGGAMMEMFHLMENDIASTEDLDLACTAGLNWPLGIARLADMIGLDTLYHSFNAVYEDENNPIYQPPQILADLVNSGRLGYKTKRGIYSYNSKENENS
jgi:3-hydroxybutyryl-CoA dehydrogenase